MGSVRHARWKLAMALCAVLTAVPAAAAQAKTTLVRVESTDHAVINRLEALGLDVTYEGSKGTEVMLHGPEDQQILADTGYVTKVLDDDIDGANDAWLNQEAAKQKNQAKGIAPLSGLPTGRVSYRTLADVNAELQQLATTYPDRVKLLPLSRPSLLGKTIYGVDFSHNVAQSAAKSTFLLSGAHHA